MQLRNRLVKADFWTDTQLARLLPAMGRMMYQGLWQLAEDSGVIEADPVAFKMILFPLDKVEIESIEIWTNTLVELNKLIPFKHQNKEYYYIKNFHKHQSLRSPGKPELPLPEWIEYIANPKPYQSGGYIIDYEIMPGDYEGIQTVGNVDESLYKGNDSHNETVENDKETVRKPYGYPNPTNKKENKKEKENIELEKELEREEEEKIELPPTPYQEIADLYNQYCPDMTNLIKMSDRRKKHLRARWKEIYKLVTEDDIDPEEVKEKMLLVFEMLFQKAGSSNFMNGQNDRNWQADFDWMIKNNSNYTKVLEGKYDNDKTMKASNSPPESKSDKIRRRLERAREKDKRREAI